MCAPMGAFFRVAAAPRPESGFAHMPLWAHSPDLLLTVLSTWASTCDNRSHSVGAAAISCPGALSDFPCSLEAGLCPRVLHARLCGLLLELVSAPAGGEG